ncbi:damage-inducible protein DinB [Lysinibacillus sp. FJAT-14745]|uniref:DinB family protein n=1 Tax=Lysinibacillus sp. FJAT-14745 TaxID=1704289 RepID=UPI0006ABEAB2|nr:DinB family protein [Lysinibacillus sp. FJAT-14745]KOP80769.1 damage-inducible protein DinB [Lysinibacillus sp. FJAT-14745]
MIHEIEEYVKYLDGVHKRTMQYVKVIPDELLNWKPSEDKFSIGDLLRHIASSRLMFLGIFEQGSWTYAGHDSGKGTSLEDISNYLESCQIKLTEGLLKMGNDILSKKVLTLLGHEVSAWRILMSIPEHEIHHRGQISTYLQINKIEPPQIFGLKIEQVKTL